MRSAVDEILGETAPLEVPPLALASRETADGVPDDPRAIERERTEVTAAILAVSGGAPFVEVCNLRRPAIAVGALRGLASELSLELSLIPRPGGDGLDILVRQRQP